MCPNSRVAREPLQRIHRLRRIPHTTATNPLRNREHYSRLLPQFSVQPVSTQHTLLHSSESFLHLTGIGNEVKKPRPRTRNVRTSAGAIGLYRSNVTKSELQIVASATHIVIPAAWRVKSSCEG